VANIAARTQKAPMWHIFFIKVHPYCQHFCESPHSEEAVEKTLNYPSMINICICSLLLPHAVAVLSHSLSNFIFLVVLRGDAPPLAEGLSQNKTAWLFTEISVYHSLCGCVDMCAVSACASAVACLCKFIDVSASACMCL
jgi:hypothetical protein